MEKVDMTKIKLNVATLCAYMGMTTEQLADKASIDRNRLSNVRAGRTMMSGDDLLGLSEATGIPFENIETAKEKQ